MCILNAHVFGYFCNTGSTLSLPAPPSYDDIIDGQSYCSSVQELTVINVSDAYKTQHHKF